MRSLAMASPSEGRGKASGRGRGKRGGSRGRGGGRGIGSKRRPSGGKRGADEGERGGISTRERHLFFDEAQIIVVGGQGGDGESWTGTAKPKVVKNFKYQWGRNLKKYIELPAAEPAEEEAGAGSPEVVKKATVAVSS